MNDLANYGVLGVVLVVFAIWYAKKDKQHKDERERMEQLHREERSDWKKTIEKQFDDSNKSNANATKALTELTTLLKNRK